MKLHEIIEANSQPDRSILIEEIHKYKRSLTAYYKDQFGTRNELILMVTDVFNAAQYGKIVSANEFSEAIDEYLETDSTLTEEEKEEQRELINFNSIPLSKL